MSQPQNLEAKRALKSFEFAQFGNKKKFNYSVAVQVLPSMIRMNGLRATMAYFYSKEGQYRAVFDQIYEWFNVEDEPTKFMWAKIQISSENKKSVDFMEILLELTDDEYRIVQAETMTLANWMIRFAKKDGLNSQPNTTTDDINEP